MPKLLNQPPDEALDRAVRRILEELCDGLRHGFFEFTLTCEIIGQERRRLTLKAGKSHQFMIPKEDWIRAIAVTNAPKED